MNRLQKLLGGVLVSALAGWNLAYAGCLDMERLTGVNVAGAEFNSSKLPGVVNKDYTYPRDSDLAFMAQQGANVIRLPFRWERAQHEIGAPLNADELKRLQNTVAAARAQNLCVILDAHNYAKYFGQNMGGRADLQDGLVDFWLRMAAAFPDQTTVAFGLMNEPNYMSHSEWAALAKRILAELRKAGARNMILIGGGGWSGLHSWFSTRDGVSNAAAFADVRDPLNATILEVHQYADADYSGTKSECREPDHFDPRYARISEWARENGQQLFLGEFGVPNNPQCLQALDRLVSLTNGPEWKGWTYWAAGRWWGNYALALNTSTTAPSAQWEVLIPHFYIGAPNENADNPPKPPTTERTR